MGKSTINGRSEYECNNCTNKYYFDCSLVIRDSTSTRSGSSRSRYADSTNKSLKIPNGQSYTAGADPGRVAHPAPPLPKLEKI